MFFRRQAEVSEDLQPRLVDNFRSHNEILRFVAKVCSADGMIPNFMDLSAGREEPATPFIAHSPRVYFEVTKILKSQEILSQAMRSQETSLLRISLQTESTRLCRMRISKQKMLQF